MRKDLLNSLSTFAIASAALFVLAACSSSGWGQRGSQQSGDTHTLTGGSEAAPTSESTPQPAVTSGGTSEGTSQGTSEGPSAGTAGGTSASPSTGETSPSGEAMPPGGKGTTRGASPQGTSDSMPGSPAGGATEGTSGAGGGGGGSAVPPPELPVPPGENMGSSVR